MMTALRSESKMRNVWLLITSKVEKQNYLNSYPITAQAKKNHSKICRFHPLIGHEGP